MIITKVRRVVILGGMEEDEIWKKYMGSTEFLTTFYFLIFKGMTQVFVL